VDDSLALGARLFDAGEFFEAHEAWEQHWRRASDETERRLLQGLIQVAAAFHKLLVTRSTQAAQRLLAKGLAKLDACPELVAARGLGPFCEQARACAVELAAGRFVRASVPKIGQGDSRLR
jgi:predicted metal-dependent hydrolase